MSDLMLFAVLRMPPELWTGEAIDVRQRHARYIDAADRIEAQQSKIATLTEQVRAQDKWISVDVRLPEAYETDGNYHASDEVLVLCAGKLEFALYQYGPDSGGWESWYCHFYEDNLENVTHWMPLPTPPKEAE